MAKEKYDADSISVLEGLEAVRKRPGMYIGSTNVRGLNHLVYEIVDNSVDEHLAGSCTHIKVILNEDGSATVIDNGRGIPVGRHKKMNISAERVILTTLHAGGKFDNNSYKISGGLHGVGSSVVNALSKKLIVEIKRDGYLYQDSYSRGMPTMELQDGLLPVVKKVKKGETGTTITFYPDEEIFGKIKFKADLIKKRLHETTYLNPGLVIEFENKREGEVESITYSEPEGLRAYVRALNAGKQTVCDVIHIKGKADNIEVECAIQFSNEYSEEIFGFCNNILTQEGGTHITGFKTKFTTMINSYARQLGILKDKDENFTGQDTRNGMAAIISVKHPDPQFEGQTKTKLGSADAAKAVSTVLGSQLELYCDKNVEELKAIIACAEQSAKIRKAEEKAKVNLLSKAKFSFEGNGKLANCESKDASQCEIYIVEGDSAGGSAKTARNRKTQAILPIRGKILNVEKAPIGKVLANAEIKSMINAFGCGFSEGYGNDFDITKLRYNRIIIMADADVDGAHIATLLLTFFYRFMPELIRAGHVYVAMPPLYKVIPKKGKAKYLYDDRELEEYRATHTNFVIQRYKGLGEMDADQLWETTMDPENRQQKQVVIEDEACASETISVLMGTNVEVRREFIVLHAKEANIDA